MKKRQSFSRPFCTPIAIQFYRYIPLLILSILFSDLLKLLDENKYTRFNLDPQATDLNEFNPAADLNNLRLLVDYKYCLTYRDYKEVGFFKFSAFGHSSFLNRFFEEKKTFFFTVQRDRGN